ncbi:MAG: terminase family protein [Lachnospiraceae bacterium]|nr:terminase family protein [Lachnospiraceae bacterium]
MAGLELTVQIPYKPRPPQPEIHKIMDENRFSVIVAHRRLGKTVCTINQLIKKAVLDTSGNGRYGYVAPYRNQAKSIAWDYLKYFSAAIPDYKINEGELAVDFFNGSRIRLFGADNADAMRGLYFDGIILDEVADMRPEVWGEIVRPALSDRNGWACFIGTPKGMNLFYDLYSLGLKNKGWKSAMYRADETGVIPESELIDAQSVMSANQYRQEFLCDFSASTDNVLITIDMVSKAANKSLQDRDVRGAARVIGVDVARFGDDKSAICKRQGLWCQEIKIIENLDNMTFAGIVAREIDKFNADAVFIDAGRGEGVIDRLRQLGYQVMEINFGSAAVEKARYANKRTEMWDAMRQWLESGGAIPNDTELKSELASPTYKFDAAGRKVLEPKEKIKERGLKSPDMADALALTFAAPVISKNDYVNKTIYESYANDYDPFSRL